MCAFVCAHIFFNIHLSYHSTTNLQKAHPYFRHYSCPIAHTQKGLDL